MIRVMMPSDIASIIPFAREMHENGRYKALNFDPQKLRRFVISLMISNIFVGFVDEKDSKIVGVVFGYITDYFFGNGMYLEGRGFYVIPEYRKSKSGSKLLSAFVSAGKKLKVDEVYLSEAYLDDVNALDFLCKKVGLEKVGSIYRASLIDGQA